MSVLRGTPHSQTLPVVFRAACKIALLIGFLVAVKQAGDRVMDQITPVLTQSTERAMHRLIMMATGISIMLAFVPGADIGLELMVAFGSAMAPLVYPQDREAAATVLTCD